MKYPLRLTVTLLLLAATHPAAAEMTASTAGFPPPVSPTVQPPSPLPVAREGVLASLLTMLEPKAQLAPHPAWDGEAWARMSRQSMPDREGSMDYMLRGILQTAVLSVGVVGLTFLNESPRAPGLAIKPCRSGAMIGLQGVF